MLKIKYRAGNELRQIEFKSPAALVADLQLEVPSLQDYYQVVTVSVADQPETGFAGGSIANLFNYYLTRV